jgi:hypothetical protein
MDFSKIACDKECKFEHHGVTQTLCYYPPVYDKNGVNTNPDRNSQDGGVSCRTCGKLWRIHKLACDSEWEFTEYQPNRSRDS